MKRIVSPLVLTSGLVFAALGFHQQALGDDTRARDPEKKEGLEATIEKIESLAQENAWKGIPWRWCLLDATQESKRSNKPLFIYAIAGDPVGRC